MATRVFYRDLAPLNPARVLPDGRTIAEARVARTGIQEYEIDGKIRRELRLSEDVFDPKALETFSGAFVTIEHPPQMVDYTDSNAPRVGAVSAVRRGDVDDTNQEWLNATLAITDIEAIQAVKAGKSEISVGYFADVENTSGIHPVHGAFDVIQRNITVNHVALVDQARAGPNATIRLDAKHLPMTYKHGNREVGSPTVLSYASKELTMPNSLNQNFDNSELNADLTRRISDLESKIDTLTNQLQTVEKERNEAKGKADALQKTIDAQKVDKEKLDRLDAIEAQKAQFEKDLKLERQMRLDAESPDKQRLMLDRRIKILDAARMVLDESHKDLVWDMNNKDLMVAVVQKVLGEDISGETEDYIRSHFDTALANQNRWQATHHRLTAELRPEPIVRRTVQDMKKQMIGHNQTAWQRANDEALKRKNSFGR